MKLCRGSRLSNGLQVGAVALLLVATATAQDAKPVSKGNDNVAASLTELQSQVRELTEMVQQLKQETTASRAEITRLRQELESERTAQTANAPPGSEQAVPIDVRVGPSGMNHSHPYSKLMTCTRVPPTPMSTAHSAFCQ